MAKHQSATPKRARSKRTDEKQAGRGTSQSGGNGAATYEEELAHYLQERIKPGLNRGAVRLLARSIAMEIARRRSDEDVEVSGEPDSEQDDDVRDEVDDEFGDEDEDDARGEADDDDDVHAEADDDFRGEEDGNDDSLEDQMRDLQAKLGDDWILRVSLQGDDAWLTAEKDDGSQHVEAPAADVLAEVVELLNESGGRASASRGGCRISPGGDL